MERKTGTDTQHQRPSERKERETLGATEAEREPRWRQEDGQAERLQGSGDRACSRTAEGWLEEAQLEPVCSLHTQP